MIAGQGNFMSSGTSVAYLSLDKNLDFQFVLAITWHQIALENKKIKYILFHCVSKTSMIHRQFVMVPTTDIVAPAKALLATNIMPAL